jgi:hypothetical protein
MGDDDVDLCIREKLVSKCKVFSSPKTNGDHVKRWALSVKPKRDQTMGWMIEPTNKQTNNVKSGV